VAPLDGHEPAAEDERSLRRAVPVAGARTAELGVLGADTRAELGIHHLVQDGQPRCRGEGEQPLTHCARDLGQREGHFLGQAFQLSGLVRSRDGDDRYLLTHRWSPSWVVLGGTPDTYQMAGLRRGTTASLQQSLGQRLFAAGSCVIGHCGPGAMDRRSRWPDDA
jgi:hypothetical protein